MIFRYERYLGCLFAYSSEVCLGLLQVLALLVPLQCQLGALSDNTDVLRRLPVSMAGLSMLDNRNLLLPYCMPAYAEVRTRTNIIPGEVPFPGY